MRVLVHGSHPSENHSLSLPPIRPRVAEWDRESFWFAPSDDLLEVTCWCGAKRALVRSRDLAYGRTFTCRLARCVELGRDNGSCPSVGILRSGGNDQKPSPRSWVERDLPRDFDRLMSVQVSPEPPTSKYETRACICGAEEQLWVEFFQERAHRFSRGWGCGRSECVPADGWPT